jgi:serine/threonine protein kinase
MQAWQLTLIHATDLNGQQRLYQEVDIWHRLDHPNIAKFLGTTFHMHGRPGMVMEWYENGSAVDYLAWKKPGADRLGLVSGIYSFDDLLTLTTSHRCGMSLVVWSIYTPCDPQSYTEI